MASVLARADNDHDHMLATLHVRKPSREQFRGAEASAAAHLVGIGEGGANPLLDVQGADPDDARLYALRAPR